MYASPLNPLEFVSAGKDGICNNRERCHCSGHLPLGPPVLQALLSYNVCRTKPILPILASTSYVPAAPGAPAQLLPAELGEGMCKYFCGKGWN